MAYPAKYRYTVTDTLKGEVVLEGCKAGAVKEYLKDPYLPLKSYTRSGKSYRYKRRFRIERVPIEEDA